MLRNRKSVFQTDLTQTHCRLDFILFDVVLWCGVGVIAVDPRGGMDDQKLSIIALVNACVS